MVLLATGGKDGFLSSSDFVEYSNMQWYNPGVKPLHVVNIKKGVKLVDNNKMQCENGPAKRVYSVDEIAEMLNVSKGSVYELIKQDLFNTVRVGSAIRVSKKSFDEWLDKYHK